MLYRYLGKQNPDFYEVSTFSEAKQMIVVIPCYNEPEILKILASLSKCQKPSGNVGIILVFNTTVGHPESVDSQNKKSIEEVMSIETCPSWLEIQMLHLKPFPKKWGGVGWARKIGMDCATDHFAKTQNNQGIIVSLDADAWVEENYYTEIEHVFKKNQSWPGATLNFEHEIERNNFNQEIQRAATNYELYMRYYKLAIQSIGHPHAIYTIGSCFACRVEAYVKQGGMNRKKAGEDFYFLHKLTQIGKIGEINQTTVHLSIRPSDRVPFGTGPAINKAVSDELSVTMTYPYEQFRVLKPVFEQITLLWNNTTDAYHLFKRGLHPMLISFFEEINFDSNCQEIRNNCSSFEAFNKRFFHFFSAFMVLKWLNYSASEFPKSSLASEILYFSNFIGVHDQIVNNKPQSMLTLMRELEKRGKLLYIRSS